MAKKKKDSARSMAKMNKAAIKAERRRAQKAARAEKKQQKKIKKLNKQLARIVRGYQKLGVAIPAVASVSGKKSVKDDKVVPTSK